MELVCWVPQLLLLDLSQSESNVKFSPGLMRSPLCLPVLNHTASVCVFSFNPWYHGPLDIYNEDMSQYPLPSLTA